MPADDLVAPQLLSSCQSAVVSDDNEQVSKPCDKRQVGTRRYPLPTE